MHRYRETRNQRARDQWIRDKRVHDDRKASDQWARDKRVHDDQRASDKSAREQRVQDNRRARDRKARDQRVQDDRWARVRWARDRRTLNQSSHDRSEPDSSSVWPKRRRTTSERGETSREEQGQIEYQPLGTKALEEICNSNSPEKLQW